MSNPVYTKIYSFDIVKNKVVVHLARDFVDDRTPQYKNVIRKWGKWSKINPNMTIEWLIKYHFHYLTKEEALASGIRMIENEITSSNKHIRFLRNNYKRGLVTNRIHISRMKKKLVDLSL